jgi:hypothetical protein
MTAMDRNPSYGHHLVDGHSEWCHSWWLSDLLVDFIDPDTEDPNAILALSGLATFCGQGETGFSDKSWRKFAFSYAPFDPKKTMQHIRYYLDTQLTAFRNSKGTADTGSVSIVKIDE